MLKSLWLIARNPEIPLAEFAQHWFEVHAQLHIRPGHKLLGYVQHHCHILAYDRAPRPTHDGASINWFRNVAGYREAIQTEAFKSGAADGQSGVRGLPLGQRPLPFALAEEHVIVDAETDALMVKVIVAVRRARAIDPQTFSRYWSELHRQVAPKLPGLRRALLNNAVEESAQLSANSWDGWSELWFDDLDVAHQALASIQWGAICQKEADLVSEHAMVIGRERWILPRSADALAA